MESIERIIAVYKKEIRQVYNTPLGFTFIVLFLFLENFIFFYGFGENSFWDRKSSELGPFFTVTPYLLLVFVPAIGMKIWSEEMESGTWEILFTLPFKEWEIVIGKYLAFSFYVFSGLASTIFLPLTLAIFGTPDWGIILSGYIGLTLVGITFVSIIMLFSLFVRTQIGSFLIGFMALTILYLLGVQKLVDFVGEGYLGWFLVFSIQNHFETFRLGILDPRDFYFFISVNFIFLSFAILHLREKR